ncbi:hypothetical protein B8W95_13395, partial [Staphylococcus pasteuri]
RVCVAQSIGNVAPGKMRELRCEGSLAARSRAIASVSATWRARSADNGKSSDWRTKSDEIWGGMSGGRWFSEVGEEGRSAASPC